MTDGDTDRQDVQSASELAAEMHRVCGGNMMLFGIALGSGSLPASLENIVSAGNNGQLRKITQQCTVDLLLKAEDASTLNNVFQMAEKSIEDVEAEYKAKLAVIDAELERLKTAENEEIARFKKMCDDRLAFLKADQQATEQAMTADSQARVNLLENQLEKKGAREKIIHQETNAKHASIAACLVNEVTLESDVKNESEKLETQEKAAAEMENEAKVRARKTLNSTIKKLQDADAEKTKKKAELVAALGTDDPDKIAELQTAMIEFTRLQNTVRVQLTKKEAIIKHVAQQMRDLLDSLQDEKEAHNLTIDEQVLKVHGMFAKDLELKMNNDQDRQNFEKIVKYLTEGQSPSPAWHFALKVLLSTPLTVREFLEREQKEEEEEAEVDTKKKKKKKKKIEGPLGETLTECEKTKGRLLKARYPELAKLEEELDELEEPDSDQSDDPDIEKIEEEIAGLKEDLEDEDGAKEKKEIKKKIRVKEGEISSKKRSAKQAAKKQGRDKLKKQKAVQKMVDAKAEERDDFESTVDQHLLALLKSIMHAVQRPLNTWRERSIKYQFKEDIDQAENGFLSQANNFALLTDAFLKTKAIEGAPSSLALQPSS